MPIVYEIHITYRNVPNISVALLNDKLEFITNTSINTILNLSTCLVITVGINKFHVFLFILKKKDFNDSDNHDGVITHLQLDILECEVKGALGSITMNKSSGGDRILAELFQILKDDVAKYCTQYAT